MVSKHLKTMPTPSRPSTHPVVQYTRPPLSSLGVFTPGYASAPRSLEMFPRLEMLHRGLSPGLQCPEGPCLTYYILAAVVEKGSV